MTDIRVLKRYEYKGCNIAVRLIGYDVIEYLFAYKGSIYTQAYDRSDGKRGARKMKEVGAATLIVCNAAEHVVDLVLQKHSKMFQLKKALGLGKVEPIETKNETNGNQKEGVSESKGAPQGRVEAPLKAAE